MEGIMIQLILIQFIRVMSDDTHSIDFSNALLFILNMVEFMIASY